jgi:hypothetical protein
LRINLNSQSFLKFREQKKPAIRYLELDDGYMFRMSGKQCVATLAVGTVSKVQEMLQLSSTCFDVNVSLNETSFALVLARGGPPFLL